jgi:hypothetical protein
LILPSCSLFQRQIIRTRPSQQTSSQPTRTESTASKTLPPIVLLCYITHPSIHLHLSTLPSTNKLTHSLVSLLHYHSHTHTLILTKPPAFQVNQTNLPQSKQWPLQTSPTLALPSTPSPKAVVTATRCALSKTAASSTCLHALSRARVSFTCPHVLFKARVTVSFTCLAAR